MLDGDGPRISIALGVTIGLIASFVQSLGKSPSFFGMDLVDSSGAGLTIQRKSHLLNESLPISEQKRDYKRPLWIGGFVIFISSNLLGQSPCSSLQYSPLLTIRLDLVGTIFQIGALPIVVLGPLGAVSLLYNAFFAKIILGDRFTLHLIAGSSSLNRDTWRTRSQCLTLH